MCRRVVGSLAIGLAVLAAVPTTAGADSFLPSAELVTVSERAFAATWATAAPSDTTVCWAELGEALRCETQERSTRFHHAEVDGLRAGRRYRYVLKSGGLPQPPSSTNPGSFRTLTPPPGQHLFDFALASDVHIGEECSGTAEVVAGQSVPPCFSTPAGYATKMSRAMVAELNARQVPLVILNGDNTAHATYEQSTELREIFGALDARWELARGSHDAAGQNEPDPRCGPDNDCFRSVFFPERAPGRIFYSFDFGGYHFVALDSVGHALNDPAQWAFLIGDLENARRDDRKTFIYFHHPVSDYSSAFTVPPLTTGVTPDGGQQEFLELMARFPNVVGVLNSHTHRNFVAYSAPTGRRLPYIENGATKEYPGGYGIVRVYEGGYMRNFFRLRCAFCREWTSTTRGEYFGLLPLYSLGTLSARNFSHLYSCSAPTPPPSLPGNESVIDADVLRAQC